MRVHHFEGTRNRSLVYLLSKMPSIEDEIRIVPTITRIPRGWLSAILALLLSVALIHLNADFPHHSRWIDDSARFTDEGW